LVCAPPPPPPLPPPPPPAVEPQPALPPRMMTDATPLPPPLPQEKALTSGIEPSSFAVSHPKQETQVVWSSLGEFLLQLLLLFFDLRSASFGSLP